MRSRKSSKYSKLKQSINSEYSESDSFYDSYIPIKKETCNMMMIEKNQFEKIINYLQETTTLNNKLKSKTLTPITQQKFNQENFLKSRIHSFSFIAESKIKTELPIQNNIEIKKNKVNLFKSINCNIIDSFDDELKEEQEKKEKEEKKDKEEITKLKIAIAEITKKYEIEANNYKLLITDLTSQIENLQKQINELNIQNQKNNLNKKKFELLYDKPKILNNILSYIENNDKLFLSKCNKFFYKNFYFRTIAQKFLEKIKHKDEILQKLAGEDLTSKFNVKEPDLESLFQTYVLEQKISGIEIRNEVTKSMIFLEKNVKTPLKNYKANLEKTIKNSNITSINSFFNAANNSAKTEQKNESGFLLTKFFSAIKAGIKEDMEIVNNKIDNSLKYNLISFTNKEYDDLFNIDKNVLETFQTDKSLNVVFEYDKSENIKKLLEEFLKTDLSKEIYQNFFMNLCENFSDLLFAGYKSLNDIKNLEIIVYALYFRFMKNRIYIEDLQSVIKDLNQFAESSRQIKEMLMKSKNDLEFKYSNSLMTISLLNNNIVEKNNQIAEANTKIKTSEEKYSKFKNDIIKEYKKIKDDFSFAINERDTLKGILLEFKNYFIQVVKGDLLS